MNIIHYYNACRHISYYNQAFKWQGGYVSITFNEKNNKNLKLYDHVFVVTVIHMNIIT